MDILTKHVAVISGGLGDIGRACALELARRGADIAVGDCRDGGRAEPLQAAIAADQRRFRFDRVDVTQPAAVRAWLAAVEHGLGPPDLIIANAGIVELLSVAELTPAAWQRVLDVNLTGAFFLAQAAGQRLLELGRPGRIVFTGSWAGHAPHAHIPAYCVAKAGLRMLCRCLALEYAPHGILVNEVAPGFVDAGLSKQVCDERPELRKDLADRVPTGELLTPEEVAVHVAHLCDPRNRNMAGSVLLCDGGLSLVTTNWQGAGREKSVGRETRDES